MNIHCLVHPVVGLVLVKNVHPEYTIAEIRSTLFDLTKEKFQRKGIVQNDLIPYKPERIEVKNAEDMSKYVEDNHRSSEWQIPGGSGAPFQSVIGQEAFDSDLVPLVFVIAEDALPEIRPLARRPNSNRDSLLRPITFTVLVTPSNEPNWPTVVEQNTFRRRYELEDEKFIFQLITIPRQPATPDMSDFLWFTIKRFVVKPNDRSQINQLINSHTDLTIAYSEGDYEPAHFIQTIIVICRGDDTTAEFTFEIARLLVFDKFKLFWTAEVQGTWSSNTSLPFPLIAEVVGDGRDKSRCSYHTRPDFALLKDGFPSFIAEFDSESNQQDQYKLRAQLACSLRLGLFLRGETSSEQGLYFLMGAFFSRQWEITRLFCYVDAQGDVCFIERVYTIFKILDMMTFLFEFYNYARHVRDKCRVGEKSGIVRAVKEAIDEADISTLNSVKSGSNRESRGMKRRADDDGDQGSGNGNGNDEVREQMKDALQKANFKVQNVNYGPDLTVIPKLPNHVVEATSSRGKRVIAKLVRNKYPDELPLLEELNSYRSPLNHVIPLMGTLESVTGLLMIFPKETPVLSLASDVLGRESVQLGRQLLEGVSFLHSHKIAHLDIKPGNLVWDGTSRHLHIIDFHLATRCKGIDEMIKSSCGTPGWSAPEIVHGGEAPLRPFNPIRADLWSCGALLTYFGREEDRTIDVLAGLLMDNEPKRRPLLHELVDEEPDFWSSGRLLEALKWACSLKRSCANGTGPKPKRPELYYPDTSSTSPSNVIRPMPRQPSDSSTWSSASESALSASEKFPDSSAKFGVHSQLR